MSLAVIPSSSPAGRVIEGTFSRMLAAAPQNPATFQAAAKLTEIAISTLTATPTLLHKIQFNDGELYYGERMYPGNPLPDRFFPITELDFEVFAWWEAHPNEAPWPWPLQNRAHAYFRPQVLQCLNHDEQETAAQDYLAEEADQVIEEAESSPDTNTTHTRQALFAIMADAIHYSRGTLPQVDRALRVSEETLAQLVQKSGGAEEETGIAENFAPMERSSQGAHSPSHPKPVDSTSSIITVRRSLVVALALLVAAVVAFGTYVLTRKR